MPDVHIQDIAYDSRLVTAGTLFVAMPSVMGGVGGEHFIAQAVNNGAAAVVAPPGTPHPGVPIFETPDPRSALADLACAFFDKPSHHLRLYGVTGTDGKTTTSFLLEQILTVCGRRTGLMGTVETKIAGERRPNPDRMTTPESLDVQRLLREMVEAGVTDAAIEVSSHALALERVRGCRFEAVALTNITTDHIEFHGTRAAYIAAKRSLFDRYAVDRPAVLWHDDPNFDDIAAVVSGSVMSYGLHHGAMLRARNPKPDATGTSFELEYGDAHPMTRVPMPAVFNVLNALAAAGLASCAGIPLTEIADALRLTHPPPGRLQHVDCGQPFTVLIDYAHTPHAFRSVLEALHRGRSGKLVAVFGAAGNRDHAKRPLLARIAQDYADFFYITNEDPFGEDADAIMREIESGTSTAERGIRYDVQPDRELAIAMALKRARPGDTVIITGKGHEQSIEIGDYKVAWNDADIVRRLLTTQG